LPIKKQTADEDQQVRVQDRMAGRELLFGQQAKTVEVDPPDARYHHEAGGGGSTASSQSS
jgi:hypothetical protein